MIYRFIGDSVYSHGQHHPRRPRGSQSGREERRDESFQVRAKEPLGTDSHRTISKNSSGCRLLIGHIKCFVLWCPIGEHISMSSFRVFVHDGYGLDHGLSSVLLGYAPKKCTQSGNFQFDIKSPSDSTRLLCSLFVKCKRTLLELNIQVHEENEFCFCLFTSFTKREIRHFHG